MQTKEELITQLRLLKEEAGSHSPSIFTIKEAIPSLKVKVDACFLSNPYATDLFLDYFKRELLDTGGLRDLLEFYPSQNRVIAESLSSAIGIHPDNIFIGNGAIEIIQTIIQRYTKSKIIINIPTFSSYYEFVNDDVQVIYNKLSKENNYELDVDAYIKLVKKERPDTVVLINPNNPNGGYMDSETVRHILRELRDVKNIILDESFIHFAYENELYDLKTASNLVYKFPNLILVKSMSKDFGIAGIRAGYAVMNSRRVQELLLNGFLWNSNGLSEYFFRLYTRNEFLKEYESVRVRYIKETQEFISELKKTPNIKVYPSMANFALIEILNGQTCDEFVFKMLIDYGIYLRTCSDKIGLNGEFVRLASRTKDENKYIIESFKKEFGNKND
jgi:histidinol-phosphate/aromatic aminotransferase/cobyric acid decarboxylase-like protein